MRFETIPFVPDLTILNQYLAKTVQEELKSFPLMTEKSWPGLELRLWSALGQDWRKSLFIKSNPLMNDYVCPIRHLPCD